MSSKIISTARAPLVENGGPGYEVSPTGTPLKRLNYFDGKFLRAEGFREEQDYVRTLAALAGRASGSGVVDGFDVGLGDGDTLRVLPGLAIEPGGRALLLASVAEVSVSELIAASRAPSTGAAQPAAAAAAVGEFADCVPAPTATPVTAESDLFLITAHATDWLCGQEDVYGLLCQQACYTQTQHPYIEEGVVLRATPLRLHAALPTSSVVSLEEDLYWRSRVASAFFADEASATAQQISHEGLLSGVWCKGAPARVGDGVPLGILGRRGGATQFLDMWSARRELIETSPRRYWAWRMHMRPWDVFLAQVLQFQCELSSVLQSLPTPKSSESLCRDEVRNASAVMEEIAGRFADLQTKYQKGDQTKAEQKKLLETAFPLFTDSVNKVRINLRQVLRAPSSAPKRILLERGIVELPPGGYLPVDQNDGTVNDQVRALLGEGVDLRFCVVRPDFVGHALEEVQHMERISLVQGLDHPTAKPRVDILVPDGVATPAEQVQVGVGYDMTLAINTLVLSFGQASGPVLSKGGGSATAQGTAGGTVEQKAAASSGVFPYLFHGAGRSELPAAGGAAFHFAGLGSWGKEAAAALLSSCFEYRLRPINEEVLSNEAMKYVREMATGDSSVQTSSEARIALETKVALWTSMRIDDDPFTLHQGDTTAMHIEMYLIEAQGAEAVRKSVRVDGTLLSDGVPVRTRTGEVATATFTAQVTAGGQGPVLNGVVKLARSDSGGAHPDVEVWLENRQVFAVTARKQWSSGLDAKVCGSIGAADPTEGGGLGSVVINPGPVPFFAASQRVDQAALAPGSGAYADATDALDLFSTHEDSGLAAAWRRLLLPPRKRVQDALVIHPRLGWVLFARRREEQCGGAQRVTVAPTKRFKVFALSADAKTWDALIAALKNNDDSIWLKYAPTPVGWVDFPAGERVPMNAAADLVQAWLARHLQTSFLALGAVAQNDYGSGGEALAEGRLGKVVARLGQVGSLAQNVDQRVLPSVPANLPTSGFDGVMVMVVRPRIMQEVIGQDRIIRKKDTTRKTGTVQVVVHDRKGGTLAGAKVTLRSCGPQSTPTSASEAGHCTSPGTVTTATTNASGTATFTGLAAGFHQAQVEPGSVGRNTATPYEGAWTVELAAGETVTVEFTVA